MRRTEEYEIRKYAPYSVCTVALPTTGIDAVSATGDLSAISAEMFMTSSSFAKLSAYMIQGENSNKDGNSEKMSMTTPVITNANSMSFVLPKTFNAFNAPIPTSEAVILQDVPTETVAVREFSGVVTDGEVSRQRAKLEDALLSAGIMYDAASFKILQYNPPYTLPWVRRNEITVHITGNIPEESRSMVEDNSKFYAAPEAGD